MKYTAPKETKYTMTRYEKKKVERLRRISILKELPFIEWTDYEYEDLVYEYIIYLGINSYKKSELSITDFLHTGLYEDYSLYENLKCNTVEPFKTKCPKIKKLKLKRNNDG